MEWHLSADLSDETEKLAAFPAAARHRKSRPDFAEFHHELRKKKHVTLSPVVEV